MKNIINYYYGIIVTEYKKKNSSFIFYANGFEYEFIECYEDINKLLNIYSLLKINQKKSDDIILNKKREVITIYENKPYILLRKCIVDNRDILKNEIIDYDCPVYSKNNLDWKNLWKQKLDYYEILLNENEKDYNLLKESFYYYFSLSELAINLLNFVDNKKINYYICHKRIEKSNDLFNPLNIILDNKTRDIAEYIKIKYINTDISINKVIDVLEKQNFSKDEVLLFLARLIYPSFYFDVYEKVYFGIESEKSIEKILKKNVYYETFLKDIYNYAKYKYSIPQIEFLEKTIQLY